MEENGRHNRLIERISRHEDENALKELFDDFYGKLIEVAKFFTSDQVIAQDVVSEVFIKLWKNRTKLHGINNVNSYLYVAVKRQAFNAIRDNKKNLFTSLDDHVVKTVVEERNPEKQLLSDEFRGVLDTAIQELPSKCRLIYSMVKDDGMKYKEVADVMEISIKTVEMHVGKALKRIKLAFENYQK